MLEKVLVFFGGIFQFFSSFFTSISETLSGLSDNFKKWILTLPSDETVPKNGPAPQPSKVAKVYGQNISESDPSSVLATSQASSLSSSNGRIQIPIAPEDKAKSLATKYRDAIATSLFGTACSSDKSRVGATYVTIETNLMQDNPSDIPSLRSIPDSIPAALLVARPPRVSKELKAMAKDLLESRNGYQLYRNY